MKCQKRSAGVKGPLSKKKGVVIVEYVLLIVACLGVAMAIATVVNIEKGEPADSGWVITAWYRVLNTIAEDME